ncbi:hypothetical protein WJ0W_006503 [Paenibacillus melissococcoides]|uniref:Uncharacterized protein n=1 Tax=Paenibacillus melissococcoides TaxID=2912268 RepID=A0ABN8UB46_9BACL|nr:MULTISPECIES: hypothetical protein [Paenibacillus]MEB9896885.1 hypothetical protein [Bacillus cereus]QVQ56264.1 hypothetical protein [Paenibacillus phage Pd_22F]CAH8247751.1 hypothetical protein WJ0W_005008 [Paenibacillus melissococcoides]CAH8249317.1 hypothetical protein WJ0W_006503 [Paenibacillus melissococcoides]CAH8719641.1 hypothetical protein HTL2_005679 [Paenibacillus melissococcoides]
MKYNVTMDGILIRNEIDAERLERFLKKLVFEGGCQKSENFYLSQFGCIVKVIPVNPA